MLPVWITNWFSASGVLAEVLVTLLFSGCLMTAAPGCKFGEMTPQAFSQSMEAGKEALSAAKELGLEASLKGGYTGRGGLSQSSSIDVDLGLQLLFDVKTNPMMHLYMRQLGLTEQLLAQNAELMKRLLPTPQ